MKKENIFIRFIKAIFKDEKDEYTKTDDLLNEIVDRKEAGGYSEINRNISVKVGAVTAEILYLNKNKTNLEESTFALTLEDYNDKGMVTARVACEVDAQMHFIGFPTKIYYNDEGQFSHEVDVDTVKSASIYFDLTDLKERLNRLVVQI